MLRLVLVSSVLLAATATQAHEGPRVWIGNVNGRVTTFTSDNDLNPSTYTPNRLFTAELTPLLGIYTSEFPAYEVRRDGGNVASGTTFGFTILGPALFYDDATQTFRTVQATFGPPQPGPVPQFDVSLGSQSRTTGNGPVSGFNFYSFNSIGDHSHLTYTLLGDGVSASDGPSGVYALVLNLTSSSLATSDPFYLLIGKDVTDDDPLFSSALAVAEATLVGAATLGDMNCSGALDALDVPDFIQALLDPAAYTAGHPSCSIVTGDMNQDGAVDGSDVSEFVNRLLE